MKMTRLIPMLPVKQLGHSIDFYCGKLGFEIETRRDDWGWAMLRFDDCRLMLDQSINQHPGHPRDNILYLYPDDIVAYHAEVRRRGLDGVAGHREDRRPVAEALVLQRGAADDLAHDDERREPLERHRVGGHRDTHVAGDAGADLSRAPRRGIPETIPWRQDRGRDRRAATDRVAGDAAQTEALDRACVQELR